MYLEQLNSINVNENSNVLITLGDSFVQGHGAYPIEVWKSLDFNREKLDEELCIGSERFNELIDLGYKNSFTTLITQLYLKDYIPVNLGYSGNGNRAAVKALTTMHPHLNLPIAKNKIVIFYVGQFCRFDFFNNLEINHHNIFHTAWPHKPSKEMELGKQELWRGYATEVWSEKTEVLEFISNAIEVQNWCKLHNARLIYVNSFEPRFSKENIINAINTNNTDYSLLPNLIDSIEWDKVMPLPNNHSSMIDILNEKEGMYEFFNEDHSWFGWAQDYCKENKSFTPEGYFTPCAHPTVKGHKLIAETIIEYIKNGE